jgi:hypothetical protein
MVVAAALAPRASGAQDARLARRLDPPTRAAVTRLVDSAFAAGLPTEPLVDKALEGASKRASGDRIAAAVRSLSDDLARARALLGADASVNEITAGARALRAGVSPTTLQRFGRERGRRPMGVALAVLGELVARGVPPDTAARAVLALTAGGAGDDELVAYQQGVARGARIGAPPAPLGGLPALESGTDAGQLSNDGRASAAPPPPRAPGQPAPRRPPRP